MRIKMRQAYTVLGLTVQLNAAEVGTLVMLAQALTDLCRTS